MSQRGEEKDKGLNSLIIWLIIDGAFVLAYLGTLIAILVNKNEIICRYYCPRKEEFYSALGILIGSITTFVTFLLGFLQACISLQRGERSGIDIKTLYRMVPFSNLLGFIFILVAIILAVCTFYYYLIKDIIATVVFALSLIFEVTIAASMETKIIFMGEDLMFCIVKRKAFEEFSKSIKDIEKEKGGRNE